ncbi:TetR family transcriptional regulator [Novosphingobium bradum]|uniref:TetR family transcriptional regulator n=1 Tax=Novosphingobium bradum TaxID=1737444 RepID=A0ABV7IP83_9SPHN
MLSAAALLNATAQILSETSSVSFSLSDVSERSGVNVAMIKYHFGNKEGLLTALLERDANNAIEALQSLVALDCPAEKKLQIHIQGIINAYSKFPYLNKLIHYLAELGSPGARQLVTDVFIQPMIAAYRAIVEQGVREGSLRPINPGLLYYAIVGAADHIFHASYSVRSTLGIDDIDASTKDEYTALLQAVFIKGLKP